MSKPHVNTAVEKKQIRPEYDTVVRRVCRACAGLPACACQQCPRCWPHFTAPRALTLREPASRSTVRLEGASRQPGGPSPARQRTSLLGALALLATQALRALLHWDTHQRITSDRSNHVMLLP